jgi:hypothetical protein
VEAEVGAGAVIEADLVVAAAIRLDEAGAEREADAGQRGDGRDARRAAAVAFWSNSWV